MFMVKFRVDSTVKLSTAERVIVTSYRQQGKSASIISGYL